MCERTSVYFYYKAGPKSGILALYFIVISSDSINEKVVNDMCIIKYKRMFEYSFNSVKIIKM